MERSNEIRTGQEGTAGAGIGSSRPAGLLDPGSPLRDTYPVYGEGAGVGIGSASELANGHGKCCGGTLESSVATRSSQAAPLSAQTALKDAEPLRSELFTDPLAPVTRAPEPPGPALGRPMWPRPPEEAEPGRIARSLFPVLPDCAAAPCEGFVRPGDWMVQFVRTGATWPVLPARRDLIRKGAHDAEPDEPR